MGNAAGREEEHEEESRREKKRGKRRKGEGRGAALILAGNGPGIELREHVDATGQSRAMAPTGRWERSGGQGGQALPAHCSGGGGALFRRGDVSESKADPTAPS
jgi:hypothetical protein